MNCQASRARARRIGGVGNRGHHARDLPACAGCAHWLDADVDLRDVQFAARHAAPRDTMRHDRPRKNLDRHPNYILVAYVASGT